jgi:hypothetical protein
MREKREEEGGIDGDIKNMDSVMEGRGEEGRMIIRGDGED